MRTRFAFIVLAVVQATLIFTIALLLVPLPSIGRELGLSPANLLLLQVAYGLPFSGLLLFGGRLADRYEGRRMFGLGVFFFGASALAAAFAPNFETLLLMRFAQGVAGAVTAPAAMAVLRTLFPEPTAYGRAMATWGGVSILGAILGFVLSGIFTTWVSWRWMFGVPVFVSSVALIATARLLPSDRGREGRQRPSLDPLGAVLGTLGISLSSLGLINSGDHPWTSTAVLVPLAMGSMLLVVFLVFERRADDPLLPPHFLADRCRIAGLVGMMMAAAASVLIEYVLALYLQQARGWSGLETALGFVPFATVLTLANPAAAALIGRVGAIAVASGGGASWLLPAWHCSRP
jgi:MFS family permease